MISADYGEEGEQDIYGGEVDNEMDEEPEGSVDESELDARM